MLLYPHSFDRDYSFESSELAGQAHPWGTVILSIPALRESFADPDDAFGIEAAHGLVEHEDPGITQESAGNAEPLLHPERERPRPAGRDVGQADHREDLVDAGPADAVALRQRPQVARRATAGM